MHPTVPPLYLIILNSAELISKKSTFILNKIIGCMKPKKIITYSIIFYSHTILIKLHFNAFAVISSSIGCKLVFSCQFCRDLNQHDLHFHVELKWLSDLDASKWLYILDDVFFKCYTWELIWIGRILIPSLQCDQPIKLRSGSSSFPTLMYF